MMIMNQDYKNISLRQTGFSLVEILVGLVIGLLATLVIMQVFSVFEGQKRSTSGTADAQTNGSIALLNLQRDVQMAGFGLSLPTASRMNSSLNCNAFPDYDHDGDPATPGTNLFPIVIQDGAANTSDTIIVRYSSGHFNPVPADPPVTGIPVLITGAASPTAAPGLTVDNNIGCKAGDIVLIVNGPACGMTRILDPGGIPDATHIILAANPPSGGPPAALARLACMGNWQDYRYDVVNNELRRNGDPIATEVVNMQAQYGVANAASNQVNQWVNATGAWAAPTVGDRNRIKAVRIVVVVRNGLREKDNVTTTCTTNKGIINNGPCAWDDTDYSPAPMIDLSADAEWQKYRYRSFETIIPVRNMLWSREVL